MSSEDELDSPGPEMFSLEQMLERFLVEVEQLNNRNTANYRRLETQLRCQFAHIRRDLKTQVTREFVQLRQELATPTRFRYFSRLPPEVRAKIWRMALPTRVVEMRSTFLAPGRSAAVPRGPPCPIATTNRLPPPIIAHVCAEAREVALRDGGFRITKIVVPQLTNPWARVTGPGPPPGATGALTPNTVQSAWTWFSPRRDWVKIPSPGPPGPPGARPTGSVEDLLSLAHNVLIKPAATQPETTRVLERLVLGQCSSMRTLGIVLGSWLVLRQRSMILETQLFGDDIMRMVDLRDAEEIARIAPIVRADAETMGPHTDEGRQLMERAEQWEEHLQYVKQGRALESSLVASLQWNDAKEQNIKVCWLLLKYRKSPVTFQLPRIIDDVTMEVTDEDHPWIQAEMAAMPEFRTMFLFLFDHVEGRDCRRLYGSEAFMRIQSIATS
ncbi:hypothetical protein GQ53DRAFT_806669 [Thozetella sp. PMI_491]|nr:hypothetical protein GQ53DRAFT_806669 [Thozetella sp. PMI_491]